MPKEKLASRGILAHASQVFAQICMVMFVVGGFVETSSVHAQETNESGADTSEQTEETETVRHTIDLGSFQIKDLRPTSNETAKLTFTIHLAFNPSVDQRTAKQLKHWQHRFRDQVIVAIRMSETNDFLEPSLNRFRRSILLRVNRALKVDLVAEALLTEFTFSKN